MVQIRHKAPARLDDPGQPEFGGYVHDARATQTLGLDLFLGKLVRPLVLPDGLISDLEGFGVDAYLLDSSRRGSHPEPDMGAFEGRTRGAR